MFNCLTCARNYHVLPYAVTGFTIFGRLTNRNGVTKPACSRLRIAVCSLATRELERAPRDTRSPTELLFLSLPPEQSIGRIGFSPTDI